MKKALLCIGIAMVIFPIIYGHMREAQAKVALNTSTHTVLPEKNDTL